MNERFASPQVFIRRHTTSQICDVVAFVRGQQMVLRCPNYSQALKWARLECKSYKISEPEPLSGLDHEEELPLFLRLPKKTCEPLAGNGVIQSMSNEQEYRRQAAEAEREARSATNDIDREAFNALSSHHHFDREQTPKIVLTVCRTAKVSA